MSEFWSGVASGLIGAVIGGVFTTIGVRTQVKASLQAAQLQVNAMIEQQSISALLAMKQWAVMQVTAGLESVNMKVEELYQIHDQPEHGDGLMCRGDAFCRGSVAHAKSWRQELNHVLTTYGGYLTRDAQSAVDRVFGYLPTGGTAKQIASKCKGDCLYSSWLEKLADVLMEAMDELPYRMGLSDQVPSHIRS
ncbi:hypothetical protein [Micromonospora pallida]|uniref:hypothetical protein n=1 Tax=Micromonospora pallida TaxID=145854 RepID=UPI00114CC063|nr:hypothetical protein [Micromonospora pallida]